ncbi:MAG TPA: hypothetical protein ENK18_02520 [Deltaproteobacteria bacterium]|nr:hypothetical protein [Deltaproteobacteria bacterium]
MSTTPDMNPVIDGIVGRKLPGFISTASFIAIIVGVVSFLFGLFALGDGGAYAWGAFLVGLVYTLAIAQGGVMFSVLMTGTWARWGRPVKRIAESFGFFLPVGWILLLVFLLFGLKIYAWNPNTILSIGPADLTPHSPEAIASKKIWLSSTFFVLRQLILMLILIGLDGLYLYASLKPDLVMAKQRLGSKAPDWWGQLTGGATNVETTLKESLQTQSFLVPFIAVAYALVFSFMAFDLIMSLSPWWFSNMFGGWTFMSSFWLALATIGMVSMLGLDWLGLRRWITPEVTHDIGKLMLAGCMFWAYTAYAQILPIWYTDMPEETDFLLIRMRLPEWSWLAQLVGITCFIAPFTILLSRGIKKMRWPFVGICGLIMVGLFFERSLLVLPSIWFEDPRSWDTAVVSVGVWLGFVGLFTQVVGQALCRIPPLAITDPYLEPHPWDVHVHSLDHRH